MAKEQLVVGLDIGTTKVCCIIAHLLDGGRVEIIGVGSSPSYGLRRGVVVNLEATTSSIKHALKEAELMAGVEVGSVYTGIAGGHIQGINSHGMIAISGKETTKNDVERVIEAAQAIAIPLDREILHVLPQQFIIDGQDGIKHPVGMSGVRLEVTIHIITGAVTSAQNIVRCINQAGLQVENIVLGPLASSYSVLAEDEKELGVALVDIGGGTSDIVVFIDGSLCQTEVLSMGGENVTKDISIGLRAPITEAEKIKRKYGCAMGVLVKDDERIQVPGVGGREPKTLPRQVLAEIIEPRMEEIFSLINRQIRMSGYENSITAGIVLTGGGAMLEGSCELAERIFDLPVRVGYPKGVEGLKEVVNNPLYATGVGLVLYGVRKRSKSKKRGFITGNLFRTILKRMKEWFGELL
ncbi:TPA: cell division protein FtsA [bacterium]|nr:cell division protein FtsA [bacterium]